MLVKIVIYNIYILLFIISLLLIVILFLEIKKIIKEYLSTKITDAIVRKYNSLNESEFIDCLHKIKFESLIYEQLYEWLSKNETSYMGEIIVEELNITDQWNKKARDGSWWVRALYSKRLSLLNKKSSIPVLLENLKSNNEDIFYNSAYSLLEIGGKDVYPIVFSKIISSQCLSISKAVDLLNSFEHQEQDMQAKYGKTSLRGKQIILGTVINSNQSKKYENIICKAFNSQIKEIRLKAIKSASSFKSERIKEYLLKFIKSEYWEERALAAKSLANFSGENVLEILFQAAFDENWWVRNNSALALTSHGDEGIVYLSRVLMSDNEEARDIAYHYLNTDQNIYLHLKNEDIKDYA